MLLKSSPIHFILMQKTRKRNNKYMFCILDNDDGG